LGERRIRLGEGGQEVAGRHRDRSAVPGDEHRHRPVVDGDLQGLSRLDPPQHLADAVSDLPHRAAARDLAHAAHRSAYAMEVLTMGWNNPPVPWPELEAVLSGRPPVIDPLAVDGGDAPAWSRRRPPYRPPAALPRASATVDYAELHCHSNFSFLDGASHPEELVEEAAR